jgi:hypothetical protein
MEIVGAQRSAIVVFQSQSSTSPRCNNKIKNVAPYAFALDPTPLPCSPLVPRSLSGESEFSVLPSRDAWSKQLQFEL